MARDELRHAVVGGAGEVGRAGAAREDLDRRRRQRQHLLVLLERVHHAEANVEVGQHRDVAHPLADVLVVGRDLHQPGVVGRRVDVIEDVDFPHGVHDIM